MRAEDYKHVVSASGEPPLAENIILDGNVMPLRNDPKDKIKFRGEDICFLFEAGARFDRVDFGTASVREFTRKLKASQAQAALEEITRMFQSGYALKTLPKPDEIFVLKNQNDYMDPFDVLTMEDLEPMEPVPEVGGKVLAKPLQTAFINFQKIKGRVAETQHPSSAVDNPVDRVIFWQKDHSPMILGNGYTIDYINSSYGKAAYYCGIEAPISLGGEYVPASASSGWMNGATCLSGTIWRVHVSIDHNVAAGDGADESFYKTVLLLDSKWMPSKNGCFTNLKCSASEALSILQKICDAIRDGLWNEVSDDYREDSSGSHSFQVVAVMLSRIGIAAVDDCLREGFNQ